jgi:putative transposase
MRSLASSIGRRLMWTCSPVTFPKIPPRLPWVFANNPVYFVTFCTFRRRRILLRARTNAVFQEFGVRAYRSHGIAIGRYVIMPDHIHLFVCGPDGFVLGRWVGTLKQFLAKRIVSRQSTEPVWQRGFFDHVLRSDESYSQKWSYVRMNPVRAAFVNKPEEWPYAGEIVLIDRA